MDLEQMKRIAGIGDLHQTQKPKAKLTEDMEYMLKVAGILTEAKSCSEEEEDWDDDDGDEDVAKAEKELTKKGGKAFWEISKAPAKKAEAKPSVDDDDDEEDNTPAAKSKPVADKKDETPEQKEKRKRRTKAEMEAAREAEKDAPPKEPKKRGKPASESSKRGWVKRWVKDQLEKGLPIKGPEGWKAAVAHFGEKGKDFPDGITYAGFNSFLGTAKDELGVEKKSRKKKDMDECWMIIHPSLPTHLLHENYEMNTYQWIHFLDDNQEAMMFETYEEANRVATYLRDYRNQQCVIEHVELD